MTSYGGTGPGEYKMSTSAIEPQVSDRLGCSSVVPRTNRDKERLLANRDRWGREIAKGARIGRPTFGCRKRVAASQSFPKFTSRGYSETDANLLMPLKVKAAIFSECALKLLANQSDLETGALAIELHS
jgi:hypothetical protein